MIHSVPKLVVVVKTDVVEVASVNIIVPWPILGYLLQEPKVSFILQRDKTIIPFPFYH